CEYRGWRRTDDDPEPPPLDDTGWQSLPTEVYRFKTAALVAPTTAPVSFVDESSFDPRGVARYLIGFEPDGDAAPQFRDDPLKANFSVDHLEQLLDLYGKVLTLRLRRTDPPAGSLHNQPGPPNKSFTLTKARLPDELLDPADRRLVESFRQAPCLGEPAVGGTTLELRADLDPGAEYDLLLLANAKANPGPGGVPIARAPFRASIYRGPAELLDALGFGSSEPSARLPLDMLVSAPVPTTPVLHSDAGLEQALADLG